MKNKLTLNIIAVVLGGIAGFIVAKVIEKKSKKVDEILGTEDEYIDMEDTENE